MRHEYKVVMKLSTGHSFVVGILGTRRLAQDFVKYDLWDIDPNNIQIIHCEYKDKPIQRKHLTTQTVLTVMSQYDVWYNIVYLIGLYFPQFPYKVIHAKLKQLEKQEIIEYNWNDQHALRIDHETLPL